MRCATRRTFPRSGRFAAFRNWTQPRRSKSGTRRTMSAGTNRGIVLAARPNGLPKLSDFRLEEAPIPQPQDGEVLLKITHLSLDPYMRGRMDDRKSYAKPTAIGQEM